MKNKMQPIVENAGSVQQFTGALFHTHTVPRRTSILVLFYNIRVAPFIGGPCMLMV